MQLQSISFVKCGLYEKLNLSLIKSMNGQVLIFKMVVYVKLSDDQHCIDSLKIKNINRLVACESYYCVCGAVLIKQINNVHFQGLKSIFMVST